VGYSITDEHGVKMALCTDLGLVTPAVQAGVQGARLLFCEANYDPDTLIRGYYPAYLKERILGDRGHLSNAMGGELALFAAQDGCRRVVLAHLSKENNTPALARKTVAQVLSQGGVHAPGDVALQVAHRSACEGWIEV
jgi:phosphoribosyl 1,2-cyclic phosphodiesterase